MLVNPTFQRGLELRRAVSPSSRGVRSSCWTFWKALNVYFRLCNNLESSELSPKNRTQIFSHTLPSYWWPNHRLHIWVVIGGFRAFWSLCSHRSRALKTWFFHPKSGLTPQELFLCIISARSFTRVVRMPRGTSGDCYRSQNSHFCNFWCILSYFGLVKIFIIFFQNLFFQNPARSSSSDRIFL